jgi:predicted 3-demethylubiquinone-9 3-methyltransferase (glyoxalase superfamily)
MMPKITPCLWFDGNAEEAALFYVSLIPDSRINGISRSPADNPSTSEGAVLMVDFTLAGQAFTGLNGGPQFPFSEAISWVIDCADQVEVDRLWDALTADGGSPGQCGWLKDRFGMSWQVVPRQLGEMLGSADADGARRAMEAMLKMSKIDIAEMRRAFEGLPVA